MIVEIEDLSYSYQTPEGEVEALRDVSLTINEGEFVSLVGPSGCGKSTLLALIAGLEKPTGGAVYFCGERVTGVGGRIGYMPQRDELFAWRSILGNVMLAPELRRDRTKETAERVDALLTRYGLSDFRSVSPTQLSGGMRQRVALIRTLATDPRLLLLDEPFSALDYQTRLAVSEDIRAIIRREGKTALLVTHDIAEAIALSDRVAVFSARPGTVRAVLPLGELCAFSPSERRSRPEFQTAFHTVRKELEAYA